MGLNLMRYWCVSEVYDVRAALEEVGGQNTEPQEGESVRWPAHYKACGLNSFFPL